MSLGVLQAAGEIPVFSGCRAGELQDLGAAVQREPEAGLVGFPQGCGAEHCRAVFTCILATAHAGAWVPGNTAGEWPWWHAPCWKFPSDLSVLGCPFVSAPSYCVPLGPCASSTVSPSTQPLQSLGGLLSLYLSSTLSVPLPSFTFLLSLSWPSTPPFPPLPSLPSAFCLASCSHLDLHRPPFPHIFTILVPSALQPQV